MIFGVCAFFAVLAVGAIFLYMLVNGIPAIRHLGLKNILFGTVWKPVAENPEYGILYIILTSLLGTVLAALAGVPIGVLTAVYLAEVAEPGRAVLVRDAVEVLAGIPSVIYGLLGVYLLGPAMYRLERKIFAGSRTHQFTGGANLLSAVLVLAVMILPTVIHVSESSIRGVPREIREASMALGASRTDHFPVCAAIGKAGDCDGGGAGGGQGDGGGHGHNAGVRRLCEFSPAFWIGPFSHHGHCQ